MHVSAREAWSHLTQPAGMHSCTGSMLFWRVPSSGESIDLKVNTSTKRYGSAQAVDRALQ